MIARSEMMIRRAIGGSYRTKMAMTPPRVSLLASLLGVALMRDAYRAGADAHPAITY